MNTAPVVVRSGDYAAAVNPVGGGLAALTYDGVDLVLRQDDAGGPPGFRGAVLAPWSNRIRDGRYRFGGLDYQLPVTEPERSTALHGFVLAETWTVAESHAAAVTFTLSPAPTPGYPFSLALRLRYRVSRSGLDVTLEATNAGDSPAPYGCGFHPYLRPSAGIDDVALQFAARQRLLCDPLRLLPTGERESVAGTRYDFASPHTLDDLELDDAFTGFETVRNAADAAQLRIGDVELWWDDAARWVQLFTPEERNALAVEPCTAPPDAFRSGDDLITLEPGESHRLRWGVRRVNIDQPAVFDARTA